VRAVSLRIMKTVCGELGQLRKGVREKRKALRQKKDDHHSKHELTRRKVESAFAIRKYIDLQISAVEKAQGRSKEGWRNNKGQGGGARPGDKG